MKFLTVAAVAIAGFAGSAAAWDLGPLITPQELASAKDGSSPVILDIRSAEAYAGGHVPGAVHAPYGLFRGPKSNPGQLVDAKTLENRFEQLGLAFERPIVIVHEGSNNSNFGAAARVYWTLKSSGFSDLSILNGGKRLWEKEGFPLQTDSSIPTPTELEIAFSSRWMKTTPEIGGIADDGGGARLVDARTPQFYEGARKHDAAVRPGTIPGAVNYVHSSFFDGDSPLIKRTVNASLLKKELGIEEGADVVSFCNTGHWAATNWFAFSEIAGIENVKLYPGSMVEYSQADLPMTNTPGILKNVLRQVGIGN